MSGKIQELTDLLYKEGVVKGEQEGQRLLDEAAGKAEEIVKQAEKRAAEIIESAVKSAEEVKENTMKELKLYSRQAVNSLKSEIATLVTDKVVKQEVGEFVSNKEYLYGFMLSLAKEWASRESVVIETSNARELKDYFLSKAKPLLESGVSVEEVNSVKTGFTVKPADGSFKVNFGEEEFENFFKSFLRPYMVETLF